MTFPALEEAKGKLDLKRAEIAKIFDEAGPDIDFTQVKSVKGTSHEIAAHVRHINDELAELSRQYDDMLAVQKAAERARQAPGDGGAEGGAGVGVHSDSPQVKSLGDLFVESKAKKKGVSAVLDVELKTVMSTSAGWAPETLRTGRVVESAQRPVQVTDLIPQTTTTQAAVVYMEETTFTNNAAEAAEAAAYGEAALALTEQSSTVRKIAVFLPLTDEQLEDEPRVRGYIDNRLPFMVRQRLDGQILVGNGTAPNLRGILNVVGIQTQAKGIDPTPDAVYKAVVKVRVTGRAMPNGVVFHPNDWQDIRLLRTADGIYIWGNPSDAGPERIWGLQVAQSDAITENTGLVGDFANFTELSVRRGIEVLVSNSHSDYFVNGKQAMRADMRCAFIVYRPAAMCTVTGI